MNFLFFCLEILSCFYGISIYWQPEFNKSKQNTKNEKKHARINDWNVNHICWMFATYYLWQIPYAESIFSVLFFIQWVVPIQHSYRKQNPIEISQLMLFSTFTNCSCSFSSFRFIIICVVWVCIWKKCDKGQQRFSFILYAVMQQMKMKKKCTKFRVWLMPTSKRSTTNQ